VWTGRRRGQLVRALEGKTLGVLRCDGVCRKLGGRGEDARCGYP
jgi:hypothetical protein